MTDPRREAVVSNTYRRSLLKNVEIFSQLSDELLDILAEAAREHIFAPETLLFREGQVAESFFLIESGTVEIVKGEEVYASLDMGTLFGEMGALDAKPRSADARAVTRVVALEIPRSALMRLVERKRSVEMKIRRKIVQRVGQNVNTALKHRDD